MSYVSFKNHPSHLIKGQYKKNTLQSFLIIGNKQIPVTKISYLRENIFKVCCIFPTHEIEYQYVISILKKMLDDNEIIEFET